MGIGTETPIYRGYFHGDMKYPMVFSGSIRRFANCDDCQIRAACKREADRKKQPARRNNNEPNVLLPKTRCVQETETPNLCCDCLARDIHCTDLDFGLTPSFSLHEESLQMLLVDSISYMSNQTFEVTYCLRIVVNLLN
eukprot:Gregarina_sp_Poly_1__3370@NODE_1972_length_2951_cov_69_552705_g1270_i0_p2_GENE_NODE_1972_length_2951_cov_69_552705_g1270_i0NODE_1972_length_2951_cov_69_552705_g1270_i0_p2_ORF_typecomplete_len139_score14_90_NODE_1972_length_2951_cov_69_552705_g1270_i0511927